MLLGKKKAEQILSIIEEARRAATMKTADFSDELKEKIRLHHETWIIGRLDEVINEIKRIYSPDHCDSHLYPSGEACDNKPIIRRLYKYGTEFKNLCRECAEIDFRQSQQYIKSENRL